jgi:hypothetical protein
MRLSKISLIYLLFLLSLIKYTRPPLSYSRGGYIVVSEYLELVDGLRNTLKEL